jgi:hypothetical protein
MRESEDAGPIVIVYTFSARRHDHGHDSANWPDFIVDQNGQQ